MCGSKSGEEATECVAEVCGPLSSAYLSTRHYPHPVFLFSGVEGNRQNVISVCCTSRWNDRNFLQPVSNPTWLQVVTAAFHAQSAPCLAKMHQFVPGWRLWLE